MAKKGRKDYYADVEPTFVYSPTDELLRPAEVAEIFRVDPRTVTDWARRGRIPSIRTLGGHRRFREEDVRKALYGGQPAPAPET